MKNVAQKIVKKGMVFGVFDGLHEGHKHFLSLAAKQCKKLIVVVTPSNIVEILKNHPPKYSYEERIKKIALFDPSFDVVTGDTTLGQWNVLRDHRPDMVFLGYDQKALAAELENRAVPFIFLDPHSPDKYKSSLLNK